VACEVKWDGYRVSLYVERGNLKIMTRNGHDWTKRFPLVATAAAALNVDSAIIDGEVVMLDDMGRSHFSDLHAVASGKYAPDAICYAFDLLWLNGEDLRDKPLSDRRLELEGLGLGESAIYFSEEFEGDGEAFYREACRADLEGIVAKHRDSKYRSGRSDEWRKIKYIKSAEFVVIGYLPSKVPGAIASLLVAEKDGKRLRYAGALGAGNSQAVAVALREGLDAIRATEPAGLAG
jgi:bifunctional non-homologous end joining protein LigD